MAKYRCHGDCASAPCLESVLKFVVFNVRIAADITLCHSISVIETCVLGVRVYEGCTVVTSPPARWFATAFAIDGFSATHSTLFTRATGIVRVALLITHSG